MVEVTDEELEGFEYELTEIQKYLDNFNIHHAKSNYASDQDYPKDGTFGGPLVCGKEGYKKRRGEFLLDAEGCKIENYICSVRKPMEYYVLLDKDGKIRQTGKKRLKDGTISVQPDGGIKFIPNKKVHQNIK